MTDVTTSSKLLQSTADVCSRLFDDWFDPIEAGIRQRVRGFIEALIEAELDSVLSRPRYGRRKDGRDGETAAGVMGHRHGRRTRTLTGTFSLLAPDCVEVAVESASCALLACWPAAWTSAAHGVEPAWF